MCDAGSQPTTTTPPNGPRVVTGARTHPNIPGYTIHGELGRGGQGVVLRATQESTGRQVAIKLLLSRTLADDAGAARFEREITILSALSHPHIIDIYDTGLTQEGTRYVVMKYVRGAPLHVWMRTRYAKDRRNPGRLLNCFARICSALGEAHRHDIVHRDLKPGNILVDEHGHPYVLDFGLARAVSATPSPDPREGVSVSGEFLGTIPWCSPEQADWNTGKVDVRTDVYNLGIILYYMLTGGYFPYPVLGTVGEVLRNIATAPPEPLTMARGQRGAGWASRRATNDPPIPAKHLPVVNETIEAIVLKALEKSPRDRYPMATDLERDVVAYLAGRRPSVVPRPQNDAPSRSTRPHRATLVPGIGGLLVAVAGAAWLALHTNHARIDTRAAVATAENVPSDSQSVAGDQPLDLTARRLVPERVADPPSSPISGPSPPVRMSTIAALSNGSPVAVTGSDAAGTALAIVETGTGRASPARPQTDLLATLELPRDTREGKPLLQAGTLRVATATPATVVFNATPPEAYDYEVVFMRSTGRSGIGLLCSSVRGPFMAWLGWNFNDTVAGFGDMGNRNNPYRAALPGGWLRSGERQALTIKTRRQGVELWLDGTRIVSRPSLDGLGVPASRQGVFGNGAVLGLCDAANITIYSASLTPIPEGVQDTP